MRKKICKWLGAKVKENEDRMEARRETIDHIYEEFGHVSSFDEIERDIEAYKTKSQFYGFFLNLLAK